ncbi:hypothetical protein [Devosia sp. 919]|uniref:hypothetical protein n=1 Tax=Devosia sp. 919 TaxID=2726065 RepID=UPI0015516BCA|nr:hypothetical protein [Devosia sp. 919]
MSDLTGGFDTRGDDPFAIRTAGVDDDVEAGRPRAQPAGDDAADDQTRMVQRAADPDGRDPSQSLLKSPDLLADNTPAPATRSDFPDYTPDPLGPVRGELTMDFDTRVIPRSAPPPPKPIDEVLVRGVRPYRGPAEFTGITSSTQVDGSRSPPLPSQRRPSAPRPERLVASRPERTPPNPPVQWTEEVVISAPMPFQPQVSHPEALRTAEGLGHIEVGDLVQFGRGGYNGLLSAAQTLGKLATRAAMSHLGPLAPLLTPYTDRPFDALDDFRLPIDPHHGGAGIMGEQLFENLAFEGLPLLPQAGNAVRRALSSERMLAPAFWFMGAGGVGGGAKIGRALRARRAVSPYRFVGRTPMTGEEGWAEYQRWATGTNKEAVFATTTRGNTRHILVDAMTNGYLVEAKYGNMGQMWLPQREAHILRQARNYIAIAGSGNYAGVRYMVSTELGAQRLSMVFAREFPSAVESGLLTVWFVP